MSRLFHLGGSTIAAGLLLAGFCFAAPATDEKPDSARKEEAASAPAPADVAGSWILRIQSPRGVQEPILKLEKAGDKYVGAMTGPGGQPNPVKDVVYKDGDLSFDIVGERQGQKFSLKYTFKVTGEKLKGKLTVVGRNFSINIDGHRESPIEGVWKIAFTLDSGEKLQPSIQIKQVGDKLGGEYVGIGGKKVKIEDVKFHNNDLSFKAPDHADEDLIFNYAGKLSGDTIKGTVSWLAAGNQKQSLKFEAQKSKAQTANVAGVWKLKVPMKNGPTFEPTLTLTQTGGSVAGSYTGEQGATPITDGMVLTDELTFEVARQKDGKNYKLRYQGKVNGDTLKGSVDYSFDGIAGSFEFEGKRTAPAAPPKP
jgi:hypothetical protein